MKHTARIYVAGGDTLAGAAIRERLRQEGYCRLVGEPPNEPDLTHAAQVEAFFAEFRPEYVFLTAGASAGIAANQDRPADLMLHNLLVVSHVIASAHRHGVRKLLYLGSSCSYPRDTSQPMRVESLLRGPLEPTSAPFATAKLAGWQLCDAYRRQYGANFITAIPANPFGPHDDFGPDTGHVIPALVRRMHEARLRGEPELTIWGTGTARREFLFTRDLADACLFVMRRYDGAEPINLGGAGDLSILEVARIVADVVGYRGRLLCDTTRPDGMPLKRLDCGPLARLGWTPATDFRSGVEQTYAWFREQEDCLAATEARRVGRVERDPPAQDGGSRSTRPTLQSLYHALLCIRRLEQAIAHIYPSDRIKSPVHLSIGQEAVSVGVCTALLPQDIVFGTYRGHALYLARGGDMGALLSELFGKATGCTHGKGGSMHLIDPEHGLMGTSAVVGTTIANAVGFAYALRYRRSAAIVASFFGDGATEEGVFAESLNFAVLKQLPILFVCENNQYAIHTHQSRRQGHPVICDRARAHGVPAETLDGSDVIGLCQRARELVGEVRAGVGPRFLEVMTYRWTEHVGPGEDFHLGYRDRAETEPWIEADPLQWLAESIEPAERERIEREIEEEIAAALAFAESSPFPGPEQLTTDVFKEESDARVNFSAGAPPLTGRH